MNPATIIEVRPEDLRRHLTLEGWTIENARALVAWRIDAGDLPRLLRRNEDKLTAAGVVRRKGNAWRLIEPFGARRNEPAEGGFLRELVAIVQAERGRQASRKVRT
jgi:hypothetical protein